MRHKRTAVILSTGGSAIVRAAYSSGKPAYGVGPGNVPVLLDVSADLPRAVEQIIQGKSFDFGTLCSSEQTVVAERALRDPLLAELKSRQAFLCDAQQAKALERLLIGKNFTIQPDCVGQSAPVIAKMAGFEVPAETPILVLELAGIGKEHPLSAEKLSPVLSLHFVDCFAAALDACEAVLKFGGLGHTCGIYARDDVHIREYARRMPAYRVIANSPTSLGSTGITTNLFPAMTLGCGAVAGNGTSDNIGPLHLINIKRLAYPKLNHDRQGVESVMERSTIAAAVERYLAGRRAAPPAPAVPAPTPPTAPVSIVDFVCEDDVRRAIRESRKIFIGPKTIVTPSARDLAGPDDVLVVARSEVT
jgi:acetaldehyde dehydrogenase (acetylating)